MKDNTSELVCFTIGHSTHNIEQFIELLKRHAIQWVVDIRSTPYSRYNPQFNRELFKTDIENNDISYLFMGDSLGARYDDNNLCFADKPVVDFRKIRDLESFKEGINRITKGVKQGRKIALMCSEKDPLGCHRFVLVSYALVKSGITIKHILENGETILNAELEEKLIAKYKLENKQMHLFENPLTKKDAIEEGYVRRNREVGFSQEDTPYTEEQL